MTERRLILVADDETRIRRLLSESLEGAGYDVLQAQDGDRALEVFGLASVEPDLLILDLMMPGKDGLEVLEAVRRRSDVPVLMLTARDFLSDKTRCFRAGADDYLTKPFATEEVLLRVEALLRRASSKSAAPTPREIVNGPLTLRTDERNAAWKGKAISLTDREWRLLHVLISRPGAVIPYEELLRVGWRGAAEADLTHLRGAMARIRKKLENAGADPAILSAYTNVGYLLGDLSDYETDYESEP